MDNELEYIGYWKLPEDKEWKLSGKLKLTSKGIFLELIGTMEGIAGAGKIRSIILGKTNSGEITLVNTLQIKGSYSKVSFEIYKSAYCFIGKHFNSLDDIAFSTIAFTTTHLDSWAGIHGFKSNLPKPSKNKRGKKFTIEYVQPPQIEIYRKRGLVIKLFFSVSQNFASITNKSGKISEKAYLNIFFKNRKPFSEVENLLYSLKMLFTIAIGNKINITDIDLWVDDSKGEKIKLYIDEVLQEPLKDWVTDSTMLFSLNDVKTSIKSILESWLMKYEMLEPVNELYYDIVYNERRFGRTEFLNLIFAIETFHRRTRDSFIINEDNFALLLNRIKETLTPIEKNNFIDKLKYLNHISLRTRLKEIFDEFEFATKLFDIDRGWFINSVVNTRNYYVHFDVRLKNSIILSKDMYYFNTLLSALLDLCYLTELGIPTAKIQLLIKKQYTQKLSYIRSKPVKPKK